MKHPILLPIIAVCAFAQVEQGFGALMAGWDAFNSLTATYPKSATGADTSISSASLNDPALSNLTKESNLAFFDLSHWNATSTVDTTEYFEISLNINPASMVSFTDLQLNAKQNGTSLNIHVRSSADSFASDLGSFSLTTSATPNSVNLSSLANRTGNITFRIYGTSADSATTKFSGSSSGREIGSGGLGFLAVEGTATPVPEPSFYAAVSGFALLTFAIWRRRSVGKSLHC